MCGICGIYNYGSKAPVRLPELLEMNDLLIHRGPDDQGYYHSGSIGLAMRRLSIIDLATGHQPIPNEDETIWVVFNGEIYNFNELRESLLAKGHRFKTKSDTEVLAHLYEEMGLDFVNELRGMFAIALWDAVKSRFLLARDRFGKKPLFYSVANGALAFSSELASLMSLSWISRDINHAAIDAYLSLQYIPSPMTIYRGVRKLEPASILVVENGEIQVNKYWDLGSNPLDLSGLDVADLKHRLKYELRAATKIRMISDVPLGAFLSGGLDSSIIVSIMAELSEKPVNTFTVGFSGGDRTEVSFASKVSQIYSTNHTELWVEPKMVEILPQLVRHYGEPFADSSALPSFYISKATRGSVTVALNGDGGDEAFAGYLRYSAMNYLHHVCSLPEGFRRKALDLARSLPDSGRIGPHKAVWRARKFLASAVKGGIPSVYLGLSAFFQTDEKNSLLSEDFKRACGKGNNFAENYYLSLFNESEGKDLLNQMLYVDYRSYLPECLMTKMDVASMANSLETRSPMLDHKFVEFAYSVPSVYKIRGFNNTKWLLREAYRELLPKEIYRRGKMGFGAPVDAWFRGELRNFWTDICLTEDALSRGYFNRHELVRLWTEHLAGTRNNGHKLWAIMMLELWHQQFAGSYKLPRG